MLVMSVISGASVVITYRATLPPTLTTVAAAATTSTASWGTHAAASRVTGTHQTGHVSAQRSPTPAASGSAQATNPAPTADAPSSAVSTAATSSPATASTVTGTAASTQWGIVQVQITVTNGKITAATALQYPDSNGHSQSINAYALPILEAETVQAGNAQISAVSGATVTSGGYLISLQSAIDQAHL